MYRSPFKRLRARCVGICSWARWQIGRDGARDKVGNVTSLTRFMGYSRRINSRIIARAIRSQPIPGIFLVPPVCFQALVGCLKPTTDPETLSKDPASLACGTASGLGTPTSTDPKWVIWSFWPILAILSQMLLIIMVSNGVLFIGLYNVTVYQNWQLWGMLMQWSTSSSLKTLEVPASQDATGWFGRPGSSRG